MPAQAQALVASASADLIRQAEEALMFIVQRPDRVMVRGKGSQLWDAEGRRYLDFLAGWAVNCLGHSPPVLVKALAKQARLLVNGSPALYNEPMIRLAKLLTDHSCLDKVFFANSGAEANEGALKLARKWGALKKNGAYEVVTAWNGFHGRTLAMMSASGKAHWDELFEPKVKGFVRVPFNDLPAMRAAIGPKTCAVLLEPVQGEAGVFPADEAYLKGVRALCDERNALLILDEIQTGIGRTGTLFAYEQYGIEPDIMTLGKGIGGGFPLSALLAKDHCSVFEAGDQGGTYCAQPLAMVAGLAVVGEVIRKDVSGLARRRGDYLMKKLNGLRTKHGLTEVRGRGLLCAIELPVEKAADVVKEALAEGLLLNAPRPASLRFMPALNISTRDLDEMVTILDRVLAKVLR
ncbi:MAG: acetylornithine transaminase [Candidatus Lambdaproteobacteria bacterium]|nr:acetylornithine transaminase [Candidatus Lambdaproteobacteria bacterium]